MAHRHAGFSGIGYVASLHEYVALRQRGVQEKAFGKHAREGGKAFSRFEKERGARTLYFLLKINNLGNGFQKLSFYASKVELSHGVFLAFDGQKLRDENAEDGCAQYQGRTKAKRLASHPEQKNKLKKMSGLEIERKFLVKKSSSFKEAAYSSSRIKQGYIPCEGATVRIRIRDEKAFLTIKGRSTNGGMSRYEFEKEIALDEAEELMRLCRGGVIDKRRYLVKSGSHIFEIDEFYGDNEGLLLAEVELHNEDETFEKPHFIGKEVTGDRRFYNAHLLGYPFRIWKDSLPEEYR